jgi:hypothetical protein
MSTATTSGRTAPRAKGKAKTPKAKAVKRPKGRPGARGTPTLSA